MPGSHLARHVRLSGFGDRAPLSAAWAWLDAQPNPLRAERVPIAEAAGRLLAEPVVAGADPPDRQRSAENGYAVRSADCDGASDYNPLLLPLLGPGTDELAAGSACPIASGSRLPSGADAVLPFEAAQIGRAGSLEVLAPVAPGTGIARSATRAGTIVMEHGRGVRAQDIGYLAAMGVEHVAVARRPRVAIVVPGAKSGPDALTAMLSALLTRDGALVRPIHVDGADEPALTAALTSACAEDRALVLIAGRAGIGPDDTAAIALETVGGTLALHGLALRPGGGSGLGTLASVPVVLLPGEPLACLVAYDMLAARLVRRMAGTDTILPYPIAEFELGRKIVSGIGMFDVVPVRLAGGLAVPIGADAGLAGAVQADGFVTVAEASEGYPEASRVRVHLYDTRRPGETRS